MARSIHHVIALALLASLGACAEGTPPAESASSAGMSPPEAREYIAKVQADRGFKPSASDSVTTLEQLLQVIEGDEINRFESASRLVAGKPGIDAQSLYVTIELLWSDAFSTIAKLSEELGERARIEADRLSGLEKSGRKLDAAETKALEQARESVTFHAKTSEALDVLAADHLRSTVSLLNDLLRQFPQDARAYRVASFYYLLAGDWEHFDKAMGRLQAGEAEDPGLQYLRAMEAWRRFAIRKEADAFLKRTLSLNPKLVRAQAKLVLTQESVEDTYAEFERLKAMAPRHPIVNIAGPSITSEYEMSAAVQKARGTAPPAQP